MSFHDPRVRHTKIEKVDFIVPERVRETRIARGIDLEEAANRMGITKYQLGRMENGHEKITKDMLFLFMATYDFPMGFFYTVKWERV